MLESGFKDWQHLLSFPFARISLAKIKENEKGTPINRGSTPKHMLYSFVLCQAILSIDGKGGVCH